MVKPSELTYYLSQFNARVGDIEYNTKEIINTINAGEDAGADLIIFPELAVTGYPPRDYLHFTSFHQKIEKAMDKIMSSVDHSHVILGVPLYDHLDRLRNAAVVINNTGIIYTYYKTLLPDYDVFDESRYFYPNDDPGVFQFKGIKIGLQICEDLWDYMWMHPIEVTKIQKSKGAELIINISASPYTMTKASNRLNLVKSHISRISIPFIYVNAVGCQDDLVFDGRSFAVNSEGKICFATPSFATGNFELDGSLLHHPPDKVVYEPEQAMEDVGVAIQLNLQDYLEKSDLPPKLLVALSGGIDSALTLTLATRTIGANNVTAVFLPTKFSATQSYEDAYQLCENLGVELRTIEIEEIRKVFDKNLHEIDLIPEKWSIADENIQARIRSNIMMYLSNSLGALVVSTGNKSEIATGYCTLYGDTAGGKNLIGDLYKTEVYALARYINSKKEIIPESILSRPPTAELKEDQKDEDSLPPYSKLDGILQLFIDQYKSEDEIVTSGYDRKMVKKVIKLVVQNEFKRDQLVQTVKVSEKAFGSGRRFPIAATFLP